MTVSSSQGDSVRNRCITLADAGTVSDRFLGIAPIPGLHQQGLEIMAAVIPRFPAAKQRSEVSMKILKSPVNLLESRRVHFLASPAQAFPNHSVILSYQPSL